jgi:tellurite resistance protein TerC
VNHQVMWIGFGIIVLIILALDLGFFQKKGKAMSMKEATLKTALFISLALGFNVLLWMKEGPVAGMEFLAGYLIELSLSVDNLFVFLMLFTFFKIPQTHQNRVLFWGILGALILRAIFIYVGAALLNQFHWIMYVFGAFLVFTAVKMFLQKEEELHPEESVLVKYIKKVIPVTKELHGEKFFIKQGTKYFATPLFIVLVLVETTDVIFAFDSIPAIFAVTKDPFIVFTSNVFAILGLRALYFCISGLMDKFVYLKPALSFILAFVGIKMLIVDFYKIQIVASLLVILGALLTAIAASIIKTRSEAKSN